jgi:putative tricarboxylic transport membrane protein
MLEAGLDAALHFGQPLVLLGLIFGVACGLISGALPAGANLPVLVVMMGFAFQLDPFVAVAVVIGNLAVNGTTDPIPCILMGIPGSSVAQATVLDGYPMARRGEAGRALAAAYMASLIGGVIGAAALLLSLPIAREVLKLFGSSEFFMLSLLGIAVVGIVSSGAFTKGLLAGALGLTLAMVGSDPVRGVPRATLGIEHLFNGINIIPVVVGLFAIPELLNLVIGGTPIAQSDLDRALANVNTGRRQGIMDVLQHKWLVTRSSLVGVFIAMLPGVGGSAAHWMAYAQARQTEKDGVKTFGTGDVRGVIAPESANNSIDGGHLIPTITFGIPSSGGMALLLAFLILLGFQPGPTMLTRDLNLVVFMVWCLVAANVIATIVALWFTPTLASIAMVPPNVLVPIILPLLVLSTVMGTGELENLWVVAFFGALGWFMKRYGWPRPPILIAIALARSLEKYLSLSMNTYGFDMFLRPQVLAILAFAALAVWYTLRLQRNTARDAAEAAHGEVAVG